MNAEKVFNEANKTCKNKVITKKRPNKINSVVKLCQNIKMVI